MTQGKIERYHRSLKNIVKLLHYCTPSQLKKAISQFVEYYNHQRYHESLDNMTPAVVYYGKDKEVPSERDKIKRKTMTLRRHQNLSLDGDNQIVVSGVSISMCPICSEIYSQMKRKASLSP